MKRVWNYYEQRTSLVCARLNAMGLDDICTVP